MNFPLKHLVYELRSVTADGTGVVSRTSAFPPTTFFRNGNVEVEVSHLWGPFCRLKLIAHAILCFYAGQGLYLLGQENWWFALPAFLYWVTDLVMPDHFDEAVIFKYKRYSLNVFLDGIFFAALGTTLIVRFTKRHVHIKRRFIGLIWNSLKISRRDIEYPVGEGQSYGFYQDTPSSAAIERYQDYKRAVQEPIWAFVAWLLMIDPVTPDDRVIRLWVGDHSITIDCYPIPYCDLIQMRLQNILRSKITVSDFQ